MFSFFKKDPLKKMNQQYQAKLTQAMEAQRQGNIQEYARLSAEAESIQQELEALKKA